MKTFKKLSEAEFMVMKIVWANEPPIVTSMFTGKVEPQREWKQPTIITFLNRLVEKGFLRTEKATKNRMYFPLVKKEDYLAFETNNFVKDYHESSLVQLANSLYDGKSLSDKELDGIIEWAKERNK